jgi:hypothetical protein
VIASAIAKVVKDLINGAIGGLSYGPFLASVASIIIIALGAIAAVNQVGIATTVTGPVLTRSCSPAARSSRLALAAA